MISVDFSAKDCIMLILNNKQVYSMKTTNTTKKLIIFCCILLISDAYADDQWTKEDTFREMTFQTLNVIDYAQTRYIAEHPDKFKEVESAWAISDRPTVVDVTRYMALVAIIHPIIAYYLPESWRHVFQYITIGDKLNATANNAVIGIKMSF